MDPNKKMFLLHRLVRWTLGALFITIGILYFRDGAWPVLLFGASILLTGFFKPRRCQNESCHGTETTQ